MGEDPGLPAAGPGDYEQRPVCVPDRFQLLWIEFSRVIRHEFLLPAIIIRDLGAGRKVWPRLSPVLK